ncbi:MAG: cytochrome c biogenesis protein ResB [Methylotenera sp.]|nr:cytochrome c biogenesis protein ResB [Oligoflexia bacterium]
MWSLKFAIFVLLSLTSTLIVATVMESQYDTPTAQYWVYHSAWFYLLLTLLGVNILSVALSRLPWKKRHTPFLIAHLGILTLLAGSYFTDQKGLDGSIRLTEGDTSNTVEVNSPQLMLSEGNKVRSIPMEWLPPNAEFKPRTFEEYGLKIDRFLSHADAEVSFVPANADVDAASAQPAIQLKLAAQPKNAGQTVMRISQEYWLWAGDPAWRSIQAGPARLNLETELMPFPKQLEKAGSPQIKFKFESNGDLTYVSETSEGKTLQGRLKKGQIVGQVINPGWRMAVKLTIESVLPRAVSSVNYKPSKIQYGNNAPQSAIHIIAGQNGMTTSGKPGSAEIWLGLGDRASLSSQGRTVSIGYFPKRIVLPFGIKLHRFDINHYEGTNNPSEFSSKVSVVQAPEKGGEGKPVTISMNEPLTQNGVTFYQASYEDGQPRPVVSIFSINRDPGRWMKYLGSFLIVLGTLLLFGDKYVKGRSARKKAIVNGAPKVPTFQHEVQL